MGSPVRRLEVERDGMEGEERIPAARWRKAAARVREGREREGRPNQSNFD
jgi:hypothetical protein